MILFMEEKVTTIYMEILELISLSWVVSLEVEMTI